MGENKKLTDYLETILNLQCDHQEILTGLEQESKELFQKVQEINARVSGLQMEVMEVQDALHPPAPVEEEPEAPPAPAVSHLMRWIGVAALLAPLLWNGVAAGVHILQGRAWDLDASGTLAMTTCICAAWGLLLIAVEPSLNRALEEWEERCRANETEEDRAIEEFLNQRDSRKTDHTDKS